MVVHTSDHPVHGGGGSYLLTTLYIAVRVRENHNSYLLSTLCIVVSRTCCRVRLSPRMTSSTKVFWTWKLRRTEPEESRINRISVVQSAEEEARD